MIGLTRPIDETKLAPIAELCQQSMWPDHGNDSIVHNGSPANDFKKEKWCICAQWVVLQSP